MRRAGLLIACGLFIGGCGGRAEVDLTRRSASAAPGAPDAATGDSVPAAMEGAPAERSAPASQGNPSCPPPESPVPVYQCDPVAPVSGCAPDEACAPFADYPSDPCQVERSGTACAKPGPGQQGDPCGDRACAERHVCVRSGRGPICARLCELGARLPRSCDEGSLCLPIEIEGLGACL